MKKIIATLLFCGIFLSGFSQPNFGYYYTTTAGATVTVRPIITKCPDGSIIGTSTSAGSVINTFSLFKIDMNGAMLWQKDITFGFSVDIPTKVCLLSDSTIAILTKPNVAGSHFMIIKADVSGNVLWAKKYIPPLGTSALDMASYSNGGMIVTFRNLIVFIDSAGTVDNAFDYGNSLIWDAEPNPLGTTVWGGMNVSSPDFFIFNTDSSGMVSNYYSLSMGPDSCINASVIPHYNVSKIPSGGSYCMFQLKAATGAYRFGVFRFDAQNQPVWAQKVTMTTNMYPRTINVCKDNGCLVTAQSLTPSGSPPLVFKFDSTGTSSWVKQLGGSGSPAWNGYDLLTVVPDSGTGWYCTLSKDNNHLFHTDSAFNGFCAYAPVQPVITTLPVTPTPQTVSVTPITVIDSVLAVTVQPYGFYRYNACSGVLIDSSTIVNEFYAAQIDVDIFPNPAQNELMVSGIEFSAGDVLLLLDITGKAVVTKTISQPVSSLTLQTSSLANGMYFLTVQTHQRKVGRKVVIAH